MLIEIKCKFKSNVKCKFLKIDDIKSNNLNTCFEPLQGYVVEGHPSSFKFIRADYLVNKIRFSEFFVVFK